MTENINLNIEYEKEPKRIQKEKEALYDKNKFLEKEYNALCNKYEALKEEYNDNFDELLQRYNELDSHLISTIETANKIKEDSSILKNKNSALENENKHLKNKLKAISESSQERSESTSTDSNSISLKGVQNNDRKGESDSSKELLEKYITALNVLEDIQRDLIRECGYVEASTLDIMSYNTLELQNIHEGDNNKYIEVVENNFKKISLLKQYLDILQRSIYSFKDYTRNLKKDLEKNIKENNKDILVKCDGTTVYV